MKNNNRVVDDWLILACSTVAVATLTAGVKLYGDKILNKNANEVVENKQCIAILCNNGKIDFVDFGKTYVDPNLYYKTDISSDNKSAIIYLYGVDYESTYNAVEYVASNIYYNNDDMIVISEDIFNELNSNLDINENLIRTRK